MCEVRKEGNRTEQVAEGMSILFTTGPDFAASCHLRTDVLELWVQILYKWHSSNKNTANEHHINPFWRARQAHLKKKKVPAKPCKSAWNRILGFLCVSGVSELAGVPACLGGSESVLHTLTGRRARSPGQWAWENWTAYKTKIKTKICVSGSHPYIIHFVEESPSPIHDYQMLQEACLSEVLVDWGPWG